MMLRCNCPVPRSKTSFRMPSCGSDEELTGDLSKEESADITWKIHNFLDKPATVDFCLKSPPFSLANAVWQLEMSPNGRSVPGRNISGRILDSTEGHIDLRIARLTSSVSDHEFNAKWFFRTCFGEEREHFCYVKCFVNDRDPIRGVANFFERWRIMDEEETLLPNGTLTVCLRMQMESLSGNNSPESCSPKNQIGGMVSSKELHDASSQTTIERSARTEVRPEISPTVHKLQSDYKKLLESEEEADVCLKVSDKEFRAHKCILRARSSVFSAMFKHDTEEAATGEVVIEDMDPESFPDFLRHIYSGCTDDLTEENVFNLFIAADKYDMTNLKSECKNFIESTLSVDTFCDVTIMALKYQDDELLKLAVDFFAKNMKKVIVTVQWQKFLIENGTAANELLIKALVSEDEN